MFTITEKPQGKFCDKVSRRNVLQIGALGLGFGGLTLADLFRMEAQAAAPERTRSIINIHLPGGPSHQDMWDLKPNAPVEYRGEFNPVKTNVPGMEICEYFPRLATMADKFSIVRALVGNVNEHSSSTTQTGYGRKELQSIGGAPCVGSVVSHLQGFNNGVAPFVTDGLKLEPGYLGPKHKAFSPQGAASLLKLSKISADRMNNRSNLLKSVDDMRREYDSSGEFEAADAFTKQAVDVVLSGRMADALDITKESPENVTRYVGSRKGRYRDNERFLRARRLVEAGVRCVSMSWGGWDTHGNNFKTFREQLPALDVGLSCLIQDLHDRGMQDNVTIAVWGEFGRTPRINGNAGRDHWPRVAAAFLAGGGVKGGRVVGETDRIAGDAESRAVHVQEVIATMYRNLGINPESTQIIDPAGRPRYLLDQRKPISELL